MNRLHLTLPVLLLSLAGCGGGGGDIDADQAEQALLDQRDAAAGTARELVDATSEALGAEVLESRGGWEGCESAFNNEFRNFRYTATVRLEVPGAPEQVVADLRRAAEQTGFTLESGDDPAKVRVSDGEVSAVLWDLPASGSAGDVLLQLTGGPCVDVPEDQREEWLVRNDDGPDVG